MCDDLRVEEGVKFSKCHKPEENTVFGTNACNFPTFFPNRKREKANEFFLNHVFH